MRVERREGMTLVELLVAMALSLILVGTAAFVFITSQKIMTRVDTRLRAAQSFRVTSTLLDSDGARMEQALVVTGPTTFAKRTISNASNPTAFFTLTLGWAGAPLPNTPENRWDVVQIVTHANVSLVNGSGVVQPPSDCLVRATYQIKKNHGLVRTLDVLTVNPGTGVVSIDNSKLPTNYGTANTGGVDTELAPDATGFSVRYCLNNTWTQPTPAGTNQSDSGDAFSAIGRLPSGLEFTVYIPESNLPESTRLTLVRAVELLAPPP